MKHLCIWLVRLYQKFISPINPSCCRFTPTCSAYALDAFKNRGFFVGLGLTLCRILRCNPFFRAGYDPVPLKKKDLLRPIPKYKPPTQVTRDRRKRV